MQRTIVSHYGIHWDDKGIAFLMQGRGGANALGLKEKAPFHVKLPDKSKHCNHQVPLATPVPHDYHWDYFMQVLDDPLVQAMLPLPKKAGGVYFVEDDGSHELMKILTTLSTMSSPIYPCVVPIWMVGKDAIIKELQQTNVQPYVVVQVEAKHSALISEIAKAAVYLPRKLIFAGRSDVVVPPGAKRIKTELTSEKYDINDLLALHWEGLGATVIRKFMRREWPPQANPEGSHHAEKARSGRKAREDDTS